MTDLSEKERNELLNRNTMNKLTKKRMKELLKNDRFPRSAKYDPEWVLKGWMGPNVIWLTEWLCEKMDLKPGMRVLDMGCGKALSSVFLAKEYGVQVWANDLWVTASENWERIKEAGMENQIFPIHAEAHALVHQIPQAGRADRYRGTGAEKRNNRRASGALYEG
jgi:cyclopropane fatty-acyl-phospholipid synthase-like methyltransferase